jgi:hypothetical protein
MYTIAQHVLIIVVYHIPFTTHDIHDIHAIHTGVAYLDSTPTNLGVAPYRPNAAVDIEVCIGCRKDANGGYDINNVVPGEWLKYTVKVIAILLKYTLSTISNSLELHCAVSATATAAAIDSTYF